MRTFVKMVWPTDRPDVDESVLFRVRNEHVLERQTYLMKVSAPVAVAMSFTGIDACIAMRFVCAAM